MKPIRYALAPFLILVAMFMLLAGCSTEQIEEYRAVKAEMQAALGAAEAGLADAHELIDQLNAQIAELREGPDKDAAIDARDNVAMFIEKSNTAVAELTLGIDRAQDAIDALIAGDAAGAVRAIGPYIASKTPPPWNMYILAGTSVAGFVLSYIQKRKKDEAEEYAEDTNRRRRESEVKLRRVELAAGSVITAIEKEKSGDGVVNFDGEQTKVSLRSRMSTEARDLVEQVRRAQPARLKTPTAATVSGGGA